MPFSACMLRRTCGLALLLTGLAGCVTTSTSTAPVHVLVTSKGVVNYLGAQFGADQLPSRLSRAGVGKQQEIRVHMEDIRNTRLMSQLYNGLHNKGYARVLFQDEPRATSEVSGEPDTRTEAPVPRNTAPAPQATP